ncbi:MAG TPA: DUF488 domain-containing protein [Candidatus Sulfotelmatobacter sp.]|nr:DUF488 domain-containing protein [Candidatus Sulfotelmatobacter sp.]
MTQTVYTIGHSNGTAEHLLALLDQHGITAVADVRSQPYSRFNPQFNRETLANVLKGSGRDYVFLGQELGARSEDPACYRDGRAQYALIARTALFGRGIERLLAGMEKFRLAILCAEKEPLTCHRSILIARYLHERGIRVRHILEDGSLEGHDALLLRLLALHGMQENNLFQTRDELVALAYEKQAEQIEYTASQMPQPA